MCEYSFNFLLHPVTHTSPLCGQLDETTLLLLRNTSYTTSTSHVGIWVKDLLLLRKRHSINFGVNDHDLLQNTIHWCGRELCQMTNTTTAFTVHWLGGRPWLNFFPFHPLPHQQQLPPKPRLANNSDCLGRLFRITQYWPSNHPHYPPHTRSFGEYLDCWDGCSKLI